MKLVDPTREKNVDLPKAQVKPTDQCEPVIDHHDFLGKQQWD